MEIENIVFIDNLPKLDLHGFDRETARVAVCDFIRDNIKMKNEFINKLDHLLHDLDSS